MGIQSNRLVTRIFNILNKSITTRITKNELLLIIKFVENIDPVPFSKEDKECFEHITKAKKVMLPLVRDYIKHDGYSSCPLEKNVDFWRQMQPLIDFVTFVYPRGGSFGCSCAAFMDKPFTKAFLPIAAESFRCKKGDGPNHGKSVGIKTIQQAISLVACGNNVEPVNPEPKFTKFTCRLLRCNDEETTFTIEYKNGLWEYYSFSTATGVPSLTSREF